MIYATGPEFISDFIDRTLKNYNSFPESEYEVTLLINSAIGLLIIPKESEFVTISDNFVNRKLLIKLKKCIKINTYKFKGEPNLCEIVRHLRNAISHGNLEFVAEKERENGKPKQINSVIFEDNSKYKENFLIDIPVDLLRDFFISFAKSAAKSVVLENKD